MRGKPKLAPLIVITGPTASGKSGLALELAEKYGGEIICADSRTIYKDMDIGTAKPGPLEQKRVKHWLLDVAEPGQTFTAADFKRLAKEAVEDIRLRGKIPFLVGGSGLYIDAVVLDFEFGCKADQALRDKLEQLSLEELQLMIKKQQLPLPENYKNKRYLIRCIEKNNISTPRKTRPERSTYVGALEVGRAKLRENIAKRIDKMFTDGVVQETQRLLKKYGSDNEALTGNIYKIIIDYLGGKINEEEAKLKATTRDWRLAKRQLTWLRRHDFVKWLELDEMRQWAGGIIEKYRDA